MEVVTWDYVERSFSEIRAAYFPEWDHESYWRVVLSDNRQYKGATGYCDSKQRIVSVRSFVFQMSLGGVRAFLCHEICHDVAASGHNRRWGQRMEAVAQLALLAGEQEMADVIRSEIYAYAGPGVLQDYTEDSVTSLADDILKRNPSMRLDALVVRLAGHFGYRRNKLERDWGMVLRALRQEYT